MKGPRPPAPRGQPFRPAAGEVLAGTLSGLIVAGVAGALLGFWYVTGTPAGPTPEPDPAGLMAFLVGMSALAGLIASIGGAWRGAMGGLAGCVFTPLTIILTLGLPELLAGRWPGFGWFFWWPCAIVLAIPYAMTIGLVAAAGARSFRVATSRRRALAGRAAAVVLIHALSWAMLTGMQWLKDHPGDPPAAAPVPSAQPYRFPEKPGNMQVASPPGEAREKTE